MGCIKDASNAQHLQLVTCKTQPEFRIAKVPVFHVNLQ